MRITSTKSVLKKKLQVSISERLVTEKTEVEILDGCAVLWVIHWPNIGTVADFAEGFEKYVLKRLANSGVFLIFDCYFEYSI